MTQRKTILAIAGICACMCGAIVASGVTPNSKGMPTRKTIKEGAPVMNTAGAQVDPREVRDRASSPQINRDQLRIAPVELIAPDSPRLRNRTPSVRGANPPCTATPCETAIYENADVAGFSAFGDINSVPQCDDLNMVGTDRFICKFVFALGGDGSAASEPVLLEVHTGNLSPNCPDNPTLSPIIPAFTQSRNIDFSGAINDVTFDVDPPILLDENFVWVCLTCTNAGAGWGVGGQAEVGSTADSFVIPSGNGVCAFGAGGDYYWFGGSPYAGMSVSIFANPGPPGACCFRDDANPVTRCHDGVLRNDCLSTTVNPGNIVNVWKEGLCADFNNTNPQCVQCMSTADCETNPLEMEPDCGPGYLDSYNNGCVTGQNLAGSRNYLPIACNSTICGKSGNYQSYCTQDSTCADGVVCDTVLNFCNGETDNRDNDWYELTLTTESFVTVSLTSRFPAEVAIMDNGGSHDFCPVGGNAQLVQAAGRTCETLVISDCLPEGDWKIRVRPANFTGVPCSAEYRLNVACSAPCDPVLARGACCNIAGCEDKPAKGCTPQGGAYLGDGTTCALDGGGCAGIPPNDECINATPITGVSLMVTFNSSFSNSSDLSPTNTPVGTPDIPATCGIGAGPDPQPSIQNDVFYKYTIPTNYLGTPYTSGRLIISMAGSAFDGFLVVYGDKFPTGGTATCAALCDETKQTDCNNSILFSATIPFAFNGSPHLDLPVSLGSDTSFDPGDCILIRVGSSIATGKGQGVLNIDLIPTGDVNPNPPHFCANIPCQARCCMYSGGLSSCAIGVDPTGATSSQAYCNNVLGGKYRYYTDFYDGSPDFPAEQLAGCNADPCPETGDACFTALDLNTALGGGSGTYTRLIGDVFYMAYTPAAGINSVVIDACGSAGFFDPQLVVYGGVNAVDGDCNTRLALNDNCSTADSTATAALTVAACYGGVNATSDSCLCVSVTPGVPIYIAFGGHNEFNGQNIFPDTNRDVIDPVANDFGGNVLMQINVLDSTSSCFQCDVPTAECNAAMAEGEAPAQNSNNPGSVDAPNPGPQDLYNGGCFASPISFQAPIVCSTTPITICGTTGNYRHPYPCNSPADCPAGLPCDGPANGCQGQRFINRDYDWYEITVTDPGTVSWKVLKSSIPLDVGILADVTGDCSNAFFVGFNSLNFPCEAPTGTQNALEVTAAVCGSPAGSSIKYYLYVTAAIFGGVGDADPASKYLMEVSCAPFVQSEVCCVGDMNNDGKVNGKDIRKWIDTVYFPPTLFDEFQGCFAPNLCRADTSGNGRVDTNDLAAFVNLLVQSNKPVCPTAPVDCYDPSFGQPPGPLAIGQAGAILSDLDPSDDFRAADCFCPTENGTISELCWWGAYVDFTGSECGPEKDCFQLVIHAADNGRCPGTPIVPPGASQAPQYLPNAVRTDTGGALSLDGQPTSPTASEFIYTVTLPFPYPVTAGNCYWLELVNNTPQSECKWYWETSPFGDTIHAQLDVDPATGDLPSVYSVCTDPGNVATMDMAFNLGIHIEKEGCGKPQGRCCYDVPPLGTLDCVVTTQERCETIYFGEWFKDGTCPANPACTVGRCCYANLTPASVCVVTMKSTCDNLDRLVPQITTQPGYWTAATDCTTACPVGRCCRNGGATCDTNVTHAVCDALGGSWAQSPAACPCPAEFCNNATNGTRCQATDVVSNLQRGGYITDSDRSTTVAEDFRPTSNTSFTQMCWYGFYGNTSCPLVAEDFAVKFYRGSGTPNLPDESQIIGNFSTTTGMSVTRNAVAGQSSTLGTQLYQYVATFPSSVSVNSTSGTCYWVSVQQTNTSATCDFLWATASPADSPKNFRAAIKNPSFVSSPPIVSADKWQNLDRDLAFCLPIVLNGSSCSSSPPSPANDLCANAITVSSNTVVIGTTIGANTDSDVSCVVNTASGDVWYKFTTGASTLSLTTTTCNPQTTFDSVLSVHTNTCPASSATQVTPLAQGCNDDGCTNGLGSQQLFYPNRQSNRVSNTNAIQPNTTYLIRVGGKQSEAHQNVNGTPGGSRGVFWFKVTQP